MFPARAPWAALGVPEAPAVLLGAMEELRRAPDKALGQGHSVASPPALHTEQLLLRGRTIQMAWGLFTAASMCFRSSGVRVEGGTPVVLPAAVFDERFSSPPPKTSR